MAQFFKNFRLTLNGSALVFTHDPTVKALPERTSDEPLRGYKVARLDVDPLTGRFMFHALFTHVPYGVEAHAYCVGNQHPTMPVPAAHCNCGFYAWRRPADAQLIRDLHTAGYPMTARLDVELAGRVIVHTDGYRAEHQRVMRATVVNFGCTQALPDHRPKVLVEDPDNYFYSTTDTALWGSPLCRRHAVAVRTPDAMRSFIEHNEGLRRDGRCAPGVGVAFCHDHAKALPYQDELEWNILDRLRTDLPTEWRTI